MEQYARRLSALLVMALCLGGVFHLAGTRASAREIGVNPTGASADQVCFGGRIAGNSVKAATEACLDSSGNWLPTTTAGANLGTAALPWNTVYSVNEVVTGYQTLAIQTTTQLSLRADPVGSIFLAQESVAGSLVTNAYNLCVSTAASPASYVYVSVSTSAAAVAGAACKN